MTASPDPLAATRAWVETFVVARDVCPFAGREVARDTIRYVAVPASDREAALLALFDECRHLDATPEVETTLLVLTEGLDDFDDYLDLLAVAEALLAEQGFEGTYQLASFHPDYVFADAEPEAPANFTNRSPFPMWHLLREEGLARALAHHPDPAGIPERNIAAMRELGHEALSDALARLRG
ncbi:DUF1415 domain-containing protein [Halomonas sp. LR5S13]|uniref:DUF1415 domain-containing protein n=1 Tax=Halomonas rhizosphaerae TaxID=3043296 RepID=UPI0024A85ED0|nr:DUF1415 domain-containing protein [Halomonas rhizosphaerae]MDI5920740.1 DUF1415 domain-containing protein [Halomonas rhizosphaerae]